MKKKYCRRAVVRGKDEHVKGLNAEKKHQLKTLKKRVAKRGVELICKGGKERELEEEPGMFTKNGEG